MLSWNRVLRLFLVIPIFLVGWLLWSLIAFMSLESGSPYTSVVLLISSTSITTLCCLLAYKLIAPGLHRAYISEDTSTQ